MICYLDLQRLKRFIVLIYDRSNTTTIVDKARLDLFVHKQRPYNSILPTQATLRDHEKHEAYQAGIIWIQATISNPNTSSPTEWRWTQKGETWQICWTTLHPIAVQLGTDSVPVRRAAKEDASAYSQ